MLPHLLRFVETATGFDPAQTMLPLTVNGLEVGWLRPDFAVHLNNWPELFSVRARGVGMIGEFATVEQRSARFASVVEALASAGVISGWRDEQVAVAESFYAPAVLHVERAASRYFGFTMYAVHLNGITHRDGAAHMWLARRAAHKHLDPNLLDNLTAGRIARGYAPWQTLVKESFEEAGIEKSLATQAKSVGAIKSVREVDEGVHHEIMFVHDLELPASFVPHNQDGEVAEFVCASMPQLIALLAEPAQFTTDAALVMVDYLLRHGHLTPERADYLKLIRALKP